MLFSFALVSVIQASVCYAASTSIIQTTSGLLHGSSSNGLLTFKGIRFAHPATGPLRWEPPVAFVSSAPQNATSLAPACVQQFTVSFPIDIQLFNTPPVPESEDCLFLNVWAPKSPKHPLAVVIWIHGGRVTLALAFGTASVAEYDGASLASNQNIVVVSFEYRTNVFGFPSSPDLPLAGNNLGFLDQELAFQWVQQNIAQFGGDPKRVTIMGQSAGGESVAAAISRHAPGMAPFRAGILLSPAGADESTSPTPSFVMFNAMAFAVGCTQTPGAARLACLKQVPASVIRNFTNGPESGMYFPVVDNVTFFADPLQRIRAGQSARLPFMIGHTQDDGSLVAFGRTNITAFLVEFSLDTLVTADQVRALYAPGLSDTAVIAEMARDFLFLCPAELWSAAACVRLQCLCISSDDGTAGPVFADLQLFPNAGAWHTSELFEIFGTFNRSTATPSEITLSHTMETVIANFVKNPLVSPAPRWPKYVPGNRTKTLAKLAYDGNVGLGDVVQAVESDSVDGPCALWNQFLDVRV
ncbi:Alpha/Beta hydrolase protein [Mycena leptocephala]|nr:Alpha/Beta hydrolase protein [Mycena leptocephala]